MEELGMSLAALVQSYTLKMGCRPFGCSLLLVGRGEVDNPHDDDGRRVVFQLDPSGVVTQVEGMAVLGRGGSRLQQRLEEEGEERLEVCASVEEAWDVLVAILKEELQRGGEDLPHGSLMLVGTALVQGKPLQRMKESL